MTMEWQPIETAPKDGTPVIITRHDETWGWVLGWGEYFQQGKIVGWVSRGFREPPGELGLAHPTHWMPLPEPPK